MCAPVRVSVCLRVFPCVCVHACPSVCVCAHVHACLSLSPCACGVCARVCVCVPAYARVCVCLSVCGCLISVSSHMQPCGHKSETIQSDGPSAPSSLPTQESTRARQAHSRTVLVTHAIPLQVISSASVSKVS